MRKISIMAVAALITVSAVSSGYAIGGIGFHWGFDLSLSMDDVENEGIGIPVAGLPEGVGDIDLFRVSRVNWNRSAINFGGKAYIDLIPFIDALELSCNFGLWQYQGSMDYITNLSGVALGDSPVYSTPIELGLKDNGLKYIGLENTPYAKLHFDVTLKKMLLNLWLVKFSGGAGVSAHFATPLLSGKLVEDAIGGMDLSGLLTSEPLPSSAIGKAIVQQIIDEALGKPVFGAHLLLGARAKLPVMPVGVYVDGKFMIPFNSYDKDVSKDSGIKGFGFLINTGISLSI